MSQEGSRRGLVDSEEYDSDDEIVFEPNRYSDEVFYTIRKPPQEESKCVLLV